MSPVIGNSDTRVNSVDSSRKDEFGKWLHSSNYRAVKAAADVQNVDNQGRRSFANVLKQVSQDNQKPSGVVLKPVGRAVITDIEA